MSELEQVFANMSKRLGDVCEVIIAGGSVRDTLMGRKPKDYDVFLLNYQDNYTTKEFCEVVKERVGDLPQIKMDADWHASEPFMVVSVNSGYGEIQIMYSDFKTQRDLIDNFDWNVSRFSFGKNGYLNCESIANIAEGQYLKLHKVTFAKSTLRRGFRFSERFLMRIADADLLRLCESVVAEGF